MLIQILHVTLKDENFNICIRHNHSINDQMRVGGQWRKRYGSNMSYYYQMPKSEYQNHHT